MLRRGVIVAVVTMLVSAGVIGAAATAGAHDEKVVKIGVLAPLDAGLTEFGHGISNSAQLAVDQANKKHAIPGWKIELVPVDDSSDPVVGAANVPQLVDDASVVGVVGTYNSGVAAQVLPLLEPTHLALVSPGNTLASLTTGDDPDNPSRVYDDYFRLVASDAHQAPFLAHRAAQLGANKVAVVSETKAVSRGLADAFVTAFTGGGGTVKVQMVVPDGAGAGDFTDFINSAKADDPDMIFFGGEYQVAATLRTAASQAGLDVPLVGGDGIKDDAYITGAGDAAEGTLASTVGAPASSVKTAKKFLKAYKKAGFDEPSTDFGPYAYDAANLIINAAKKVLKGEDSIPQTAREQVVAAIQKTRTGGASGKIRFDKFGDTTHILFTLFRVKNGEWVPIKP